MQDEEEEDMTSTALQLVAKFDVLSAANVVL